MSFLTKRLAWIAVMLKPAVLAQSEQTDAVFRPTGSNPGIYVKRPWPPKPVSGRSHLGGLPHLPSHLDWPCNSEGIPYHFLAQIDLSMVPSGVEGLPSKGALFFFATIDGEIGTSEGGWGTDEAGAVHYAEIFGPEKPAPAQTPSIEDEDIGATYERNFFLQESEIARSYPKAPIDLSLIYTSRDATGYIDTNGQFHLYDDDIENAKEEDYPWTKAYLHNCQDYHTLSPVDFLPPASKEQPFPQLWISVERIASGIIRAIIRTKWHGESVLDEYFEGAESEYYKHRNIAILHDMLDGAQDWVKTAKQARSCQVPDDQRALFYAWIYAVATRVIDRSAPIQLDWVMRFAMHDTVRQMISDDEALARLPEDYFARSKPWLQKYSRHQMLGCPNVQKDIVFFEDVLLLQLDSDYGVGFMFGDCGTLEFWINPDDLARLDFSRVRLV